MNMNFGDWELLKIVLLALREDEINGRTDSPVGIKVFFHTMVNENNMCALGGNFNWFTSTVIVKAAKWALFVTRINRTQCILIYNLM